MGLVEAPQVPAVVAQVCVRQGNESNTGRAAGSLAASYGHAVLLLVLAVLDCNSWELSVGRRC